MKKTISVSVLFMCLVVVFSSLAFGQAQFTEDLKILNNQLKKYFHQGDYKAALPVAEKIRTVTENKYGFEHVETANSYNDLALIYIEYRRYAEAENLANRALKIHETKSGPDSACTADIYSLLAEIYQKTGRLSEAIRAQDRAEKIRKKTEGKKAVCGNFEPLEVLGGTKTEITRPGELKLVWNVWAEEGTDIRYEPLTQLKPETAEKAPEYSIYVHLANNGYEEKTFGTLKAEDELKKKIMEQLPLTTPSLPLKIILILDAEYFEPLEKPYEDMTINLTEIRTQFKAGYTMQGKPLDLLKKQKPIPPNFVFGSVRFDGIKTRGKEGTGYIGVAIWHNGKPVDDFSLAFCISSSSCKDGPPKLASRERQSLPGNLSSIPAAALHFFDLGSDKVAGVFWNNRNPGKFTIWDTGRSKNGFYDQLGTIIIPNLNKSATPEDWLSNGSALFSLLFPDNTKGGAESGLQFKKYIKEQIKTKPFENDKPPLLFVRFTENKADLPFIIPIGLVAVDTGNGKKDFIGFHYKIEEPLAKDIATVKPGCIKRWVVSLPTKDQEEKLQTAYQHIESNVVTTWKAYAKKEFFDSIRRPTQETEFNSFGAWIEKDQKDEGSAAIIAMSHHGKGVLSDSSGEVLALNLKRQFTEPSIAILNGCGTMEPGATDFIKALNERGVNTVIATSTSVESPMAGDFLTCLGQEIKKAQNEGKNEISMSDAFARTLRCLYQKDNGYDMKVLKYSLLGDGDLRLCIPEIAQKEEGK